MTYILERLYLGDLEDALNTGSLLQKGISHILTIEMRPLPIHAHEQFTYKHVHALDVVGFDLLSHFDECLKFIDDGRQCLKEAESLTNECNVKVNQDSVMSEKPADTCNDARELKHHLDTKACLLKSAYDNTEQNNDNLDDQQICSNKNDCCLNDVKFKSENKNRDNDISYTTVNTGAIVNSQNSKIYAHVRSDNQLMVKASKGSSVSCEEDSDAGNTLAERCGVFVHCLAGQSRSAAIVVAYVMRLLDLNLEDAISLVRRQRPSIGPNSGFMYQLYLYEKMGCHLNIINSEYRQYRLKLLSQQIIDSANTAERLLGNYFSSEFCNGTESSEVYKCKKCRRALFRSSSVTSHVAGAGEAAFKSSAVNRRDESVFGSHDSRLCSASLFVEPVDWMRSGILCLSGKLNCPKCSSKVGTFNWSGDRCCCGTWVTPAFHIQTSKVDHCRILNTGSSGIVKSCPVAVLPSKQNILPSAATEAI